MNSRKYLKFLLFAFVLIFTGCTSFKINPKVENVNNERSPINTFSYAVKAPYKNHFFEQDAHEITKIILSTSSQIETLPKGEHAIHLAINLKQRSHGGACGQDYLTGLTLGLIPSWCTRPEMYKFNFKLIKNGETCASKEYVIDETVYAHLILIPFGLFELATGAYTDILDLYKSSLISFINKSDC